MGVDGGEAQGLLFPDLIQRIAARLDDGGVKVEVVGHDRSAQDSDGDEELPGIGHNGRRGEESGKEWCDFRSGEEQFQPEAGGDGCDENDHKHLNVAEAALLEQEEEENIKGGDQHPPEQGDVEEEVQRDGRADDFRKITGSDGCLGGDPERNGGSLAVVLTATLGEVVACDDAES